MPLEENLPLSIKQQVYQQWNEIPEWFQAGEPLDGLETYSRAYFEEGKRLRYRPERFECIRDFVDFPAYKDQLLIEVGTGQGCDLNEFAAAGAHVIGADLSQRNCLVAQQRLETYGRQGHFVNVDAESIPLCDNAVDHVYSFGVLHHTPDMFGAFQEVARIVKPGGTVTMMLYRKNWSLVALAMHLPRLVLPADGQVGPLARLLPQARRSLSDQVVHGRPTAQQLPKGRAGTQIHAG